MDNSSDNDSSRDKKLEQALANISSIQQSVMGIHAYLYGQYYGVENAVVPEGTKSISGWTFTNNPQLKSISIPSSVTEIQSNFYEDCVNLEEIIVDENNPVYASVDGCLYNKDKSHFISCPPAKKGEINFDPAVKEIKEFAFHNCCNLKKVVIPESITELKDKVFFFCTIGEIVIPESVTKIGQYAFLAYDSSEHPIKIIVKKGSYAEKYAKETGIKFEVK